MNADMPPDALSGKTVLSVDGDEIGVARDVVADGAGRATHVEVELPSNVRRSISITGARLANDRVFVTYTAEQILQLPPPTKGPT
jgi:PRC-barrel domain